MKTLYLVRHARAAREAPTLADRDRPLDERGARDAAAMGRRLAGRGVEPDALRTSPALRALETAQRFADALGRPRAAIVVDDRLYASRAGTLLAVVQGLDDLAGSAMLFGHNPEFSELVGRLAGRFVDLTPGAVAQLRFAACRWAEIGAVAAEACTIDTPPG
jgi:phosphohistidine phosphatase